MRICAGVLVRASNPTLNQHFTGLGYKWTELPRARAAHASHPMRMKRLGLQFVVAAIRTYPKFFAFLEDNAEKYKRLLDGQKTCFMELYISSNKKIDFYCPLSEVSSFWLTSFPQPRLLKDEPSSDSARAKVD